MSMINNSSRTARRVAALGVAMTVAVLGTAVPASAHTELRSAAPADGETVPPPARIVLAYTDPVQLAQVVVIDHARHHYESGKPSIVDNTVTEQVGSTLPSGSYTVSWRVVSPDGHPVTGTYGFTVAGSAAGATAPATAPASGPATATGSPAAQAAPATGDPGGPSGARGGSSGGSGGSRWAGLGVVLIIAIGLGAAAVLRRRSGGAGAAGTGSQRSS